MQRRHICKTAAPSQAQYDLNDAAKGRKGSSRLIPQHVFGIPFVYVAGVFSIILVLALGVYSSEYEYDALPKSTGTAMQSKGAAVDLSSFENCTLSFVPPPPNPNWETAQGIWVPSFPNSGAGGPSGVDDILKNLIPLLTGVKNGARSYYASSRIVKRCRGGGTTVTCSVHHPIVPMEPSPESPKSRAKRELFFHSIIYPIRSPKTLFAAHYNDKALKYHNVAGQPPVNDWRSFRDTYLEGNMANWKRSFMTWKNMTYFDIGMYLPFERLMDPARGPAVVQQLADQLQLANFTVAPARDMSCIWYQATGRLRDREAEYYDYIPGFTAEQRDYMITEIEKFMEEVNDDTELVSILKEYRDDIRDNTVMDRLWENMTASG